MYNKLFSILVILLLLYCLQLNAFSYDDFGGRYGYTQYTGDDSKINSIQFSDEEILIILDFSSSMQKKLTDQPRINYAISALHNVIDKLPDNTKIGLRIFGPDEKSLTMYRSGSGINTNGDCKASRLEVPISSGNKSSVKNKLSAYMRPFGETPIGYSLRQAINNDFISSSSLKHIVLITDGQEGCGDDPCRYIKEIMSKRNDIRIDVIGISTDENAYSQLSCITNATNGKYYVVTNAQDLFVSIETAIINTNSKINTPNITTNNISLDNNTDQKVTTNSYSHGFSPSGFSTQDVKLKDNMIYNNKPDQRKPPSRIKYSKYSFEFDI